MPNHHYPKKHLGQHFLRNQHIIERIVGALNLQATDHLLEIGPGQGALTQALLPHLKQLHVVEIDPDAIAVLKQRCPTPKLIIHQADILEFAVSSIGQQPLRLVGNLPYNISTPLLFHLLKSVDCISDMVFMLQREVAERIVATPGNKTYGRLSVMLQYACAIDLLFYVAPSAFFPPPQVESAVIRLMPRSPTLPAKNVEQFALLVKQAFSQRRKTIQNNLRGLLSAAQFTALGIAPTRRAEELSVVEFVRLANARAGESSNSPRPHESGGKV